MTLNAADAELADNCRTGYLIDVWGIGDGMMVTADNRIGLITLAVMAGRHSPQRMEKAQQTVQRRSLVALDAA